MRGFDGHLETTAGGLNAPEGKSYWEFGIGEDYKRKASEEFERVSRMVPEDVRQSTEFVFVSPWTWDSSDPQNKLEDWESRSSGTYPWKAMTLHRWGQIGIMARGLPGGISLARKKHFRHRSDRWRTQH